MISQFFSGTRSTKWCAVAFAFLLGLSSSSAVAKDINAERAPLPTLEVAPGGGNSFRAAVLRFRTIGESVGDQRIEDLRDEIERGLTFSSEVLPLDHAAYLAPEESPAVDSEQSGAIDCDSWKQSGADAVV